MNMNYYVADTYKYMERVGEPFEKNGKPYTKVVGTCDRCGGSGVFACRVENGHIVPHPAYNGVCLKCGGSGKLEKVVRLYTESEYNSAQRAKEKRQEKARAAAEARVEARRADAFTKWCGRNGFDSDGYTYMITGNTYPIKEELKSQGYKFSKELKWHGATEVEVPEDCFVDRIHWEDIYNWDEAGCCMFLKDEAEEFLNELAAAHSEGAYVGEIGERLRRIEVIFTGSTSFESYYGTTNVYRFTHEGAQLVWFTQTEKDFEENEHYLLTGTVKDHKIYGNKKTTYLSRCNYC